MNSKDIGNIGEARVIYKFVEMGIPVFTPFGDNEACDLIADFKKRLNRIQVKTSEKISKGVVKFELSKTGIRSGKTYSSFYKENEVDYFACYNIEADSLSLIPFYLSPRTQISIRIEPPKNNQHSGIWMLKEWTFEKTVYEK